MEASVLTAATSGFQRGGFPVRLGDPASLKWQPDTIPACISAAKVALPAGEFVGDDDCLCEDAIKSQSIIASTLRFAVQEGIAGELVERLLDASDLAMFPLFLSLGNAVTSYICEQAMIARSDAVGRYREWCKQIGGERLLREFDRVFGTISSHCDFEFGLVRDVDGSTFGQDSEEYRFRLFTDPDVMLLNQYLCSDDFEQMGILNYIYRKLMPCLVCVSQFDFMDGAAYFMPELVSSASLENLTIPQLRDLLQLAAQGLLVDDEEGFGLSGDCCSSIVDLVGDKISTLIKDISAVHDEYGYEDANHALTELVLSHLSNAVASEVKNQSEAIGGLPEPLSKSITDDPTFLSDFLAVAGDDIGEIIAIAGGSSGVLDYAGESDIGIHTNLVIRYQTDPDLDEYWDNHISSNCEYINSGEVAQLSACIRLQPSTIDAVCAWQRSLVLFAALTACTQRKDTNDDPCD